MAVSVISPSVVNKLYHEATLVVPIVTQDAKYIAKAIWQSRSPQDMPILADALEDVNDCDLSSLRVEPKMSNGIYWQVLHGYREAADN